MDDNNVTANTFSNISNTQIDNANAIFTSEKLDKLENLTDTLKDFRINDSECYLSKSAASRDTQDNLTRNPKTVTYTSNRK